MRFAFALGITILVGGCSLLVETGDLDKGTDDGGSTPQPEGGNVPVIEAGVDGGSGSEAGTYQELDGLIGAWLFDDGTVSDSSGFERVGALDGDAKIVAAPDRSGRALELSGNGSMSIDELSGLGFPNEEGTLSFWMRWRTMEKAAQSCFFDEWTDGRDHIFVRKANNDAPGSIQIAFQEEIYEFEDGFDLIPNRWAHVVISWDTENREGRIVVDGKTIAYDTYEGTTFKPTAQRMTFGLNLDGFIDDIRLFRRPLSESEAIALP